MYIAMLQNIRSNILYEKDECENWEARSPTGYWWS